MMFNYEINIPQMLITVKKGKDTLGYVAIDSPLVDARMGDYVCYRMLM